MNSLCFCYFITCVILVFVGRNDLFSIRFDSIRFYSTRFFIFNQAFIPWINFALCIIPVLFLLHPILRFSYVQSYLMSRVLCSSSDTGPLELAVSYLSLTSFSSSSLRSRVLRGSTAFQDPQGLQDLRYLSIALFII